MAGIRERKSVFNLRSVDRKPTPSLPSTLTTPEFPHAEHIKQVREQLTAFGFGEPVRFLTENGLDRPSYLAFARKKLLGQEYENGIPQGKRLPEKVGEVDIPENVRQHGQDIFTLLFSYNVGYGHLRPALAMQNLIELMGGEAKSMFLGGAEDVIPRTSKIDFGGYKDLNRLLRAVSWYYRVTNLNTAHRQGMMHEPPDLKDPDQEYTSVAKTFLWIASDKKKFKENPDAAIAEVMTFSRERNGVERWLSKRLFSLITRRSLRNLVRSEFKQHPNDEKLLISTHPIVSEAFGTISSFTKNHIGYTDANFQPDVGMFYDSYTKKPKTYTERSETVEKWGIHHRNKPAQYSTVLDGYITPLSIFNRTELAEKRRQALEDGQPLTIIATASGNAPAQLGAFKEMVIGNLDHFRDKKLRMVIECGAEEGGGLAVYNDLKQLVDENQLTDSIVLHASKTPEASIQFFEALSWTPQPIAMQVKASEMTRIAQALNIPLISTGALGDHELWNLAATLLDNPTSVVFTEKVSRNIRSDIERVFTHDILVRKHPERQYIETLVGKVDEQTTTSMEQLLTLVNHYIMSGQESQSNAGAMLYLLSDMISRKHPQKKS